MRKCEEKHPWPVKCRYLYIVYVCVWGGFWCCGSQSISNDYLSLLDQEHDQLYTVCSMRIIVDQWVLKDQNADKNVMSLIVHNHINSLNVIYEKNVRYKGRQLRSYLDVFFLGWPSREKSLKLWQMICGYRFTIKDGDLQFRDAEWCRKNPDSVSCVNPSFWKDRTPTDFLNVTKFFLNWIAFSSKLSWVKVTFNLNILTASKKRGWL